jgi:2-keto-3-deoxy-6-phosphogluconate aldolase
VQNGAQVFELISYYITAGSSGAGTVLTFQELLLSSTAGALAWSPLVSPAAITAANSTNYNASINGPFHGLRIMVSGVVGNGISYARLTGTVRTL